MGAFLSFLRGLFDGPVIDEEASNIHNNTLDTLDTIEESGDCGCENEDCCDCDNGDCTGGCCDECKNENSIPKIFNQDTKKAALIIGINYVSNNIANDDLNGCVNDVNNIKSTLINHIGFEEENITTLINAEATYENILDGFKKMSEFSKFQDTELWVSYSGHGGGKFSTEESDGQNEFICPADYMTSGIIEDKWIRENFINQLHLSTKCFVLMDCCNSGSNMNLPFTYTDENEEDKDNSLCKIIKISGCKDDQTSADYFDRVDQTYQGALTNSFSRAVEYDRNMKTLYENILKSLKDRQFTQLPDLSYTDSTLICYDLW